MARTHGRPSIVERFWSKVDIRGPGECWPWTGKPSPDGYGRFGVGRVGSRNIILNAQVFALILTTGEDQAGRYGLHTCDNRPCCNPADLYWGNHLDNMRDMAARGRASRWGEANPAVKLSTLQVLAIREAVGSYRQIAESHGVSKTTVGQIKREEVRLRG